MSVTRRQVSLLVTKGGLHQDYGCLPSAFPHRHHTVHLVQKPHQCPHCPFAARMASHLRRHLRLHTGAKPYRCPYCPYTCNILVSTVPGLRKDHQRTNSVQKSSSEKLIISSDNRKITRLLWKQKAHYRIDKIPHSSLFSARLMQSTPARPISLRSILILYFHLCLGLQCGFFPSGFWFNFVKFLKNVSDKSCINPN